MPDEMRRELYLNIGHILSQTTFEAHDLIDLKDEMKVLIAAHAGLLLAGGIGEFSNLKTVHVHRRKFRLQNKSWTTHHEGDDLHLAWNEIEKGVEQATGWNPLLFRLTEALIESVGWRDQETAISLWLRGYNKSTTPLKRLRDVDIFSPAHALQLCAQEFFECPEQLQDQDSMIYEILCAYFQTDPVEWKAVRRHAIENQPVPIHWHEWLNQVRYYNEIPEDKRALLHRQIHIILDEIDLESSDSNDVPAETKVIIAANAGLLLLGPNHKVLEGLSQITFDRGHKRHTCSWQGDHMNFGWEKVQEDLADHANARNGLILGFFSFLHHAQPIEHPALAPAFEAYEKRKRDRELFGWEWDGCKITDDFAAGHFVTFLEQPHNVQHDLPELYAAFQEYFALDPIEWDRLAKAKRRVSFDPRWRMILSETISLYKKLPKPEQEKIEHLIPEFLAQVDFIPQGIPEITEEMKVTIAAEACILVLGRDLNDYRNLRTVELWKGNPDGKRDTVGDANRERVRLNWEFTAETALTGDDNYNIVLHEFAHVIDNADDGDADSIPLPSTAQDRRLWEDLIHREQSAIRSSRYRDDKHLVREYGATNKAEFFTCATEAFFEKPVEMKRDHANIYELLQKFYQLDPAAWPSH